MYYKAEGISQDYENALGWFKKAAEHGHHDAQISVGRIYYFGQGVPQDYKMAFKWAKKSAEQGHKDAQLIIGNMYSKGEGVPQDYVQAHKWFNLAGANGVAEGAKNRDIIAQKMSFEQISEAQRLAGSFKLKQ